MNSVPVKPAGSEERWIAHLAGSFNPVHLGHVAIARKLIEVHGFDEVVFAPNSSHYPKAGLAPEEDRLALLRVAVEGDPRFRVSTIELGRETWVRTVDAVQALNEELAADGPFRLFSVRGEDWLARLAKWKEADRLAGLCDLIVVGRPGANGLGEFEWPGRVFELGTEGVPDVSSTEIRKAIFAGRHEMPPLPSGVFEEILARSLYGTTPPGEAWIPLQRPGYAGKAGAQKDRDRARAYGATGFQTAFLWGNRVIAYEAALMLYEDAYLEHLRTHPDDLEWLAATACEVYDNSDTNVLSGLDYTAQEALSTHLQDIAIRRCMVRLGREFRGDHLVEVRGHKSEGYRLNPGKVAFHRPDMIVRPEAKLPWCETGSVELFWQSNKVLLVRERAFTTERPLFLTLFIENSDGDLLMEMHGDRPRRLPECRFDRGADYSGWLRSAIAPYGLTPEDLTPSFVDPVASEEGVHALFSTRSDRAAARANLACVKPDRVNGAHPPKVQMKLLKKHRKSLPAILER